MEFIKIEQAKALSLLGFSESCVGGFDDRSNELYISYNSYDGECFNREHYLLAPTYAQAFKWFREKHNMKFHIWEDKWNHWCTPKVLVDGDYKELESEESMGEAELACLKKLIEIVKNDK